MNELSAAARVLVVACYLLAGATFALTVSRYLNSPLRFDEVEWPVQAEGIVRHGVPKVLYSEERRLYVQPYYGYDAHYSMWHPPVYLYSLAASAALFGTGNIPMRAVGLAWFGLSLWLALRIAGHLSEAASRPLQRGILLALILLTPLLAEGSLYLDIDNTSLAASLLLFSWFFLRSSEEPSSKRLVVLSVLFMLCLWSKLTTPFILLGSLVAYYWMNRRFKQGIYYVLFIGGFGIVLFGLTYWIYCRVLQYPAWFMFDVTYWGKIQISTHFNESPAFSALALCLDFTSGCFPTCHDSCLENPPVRSPTPVRKS
jgi:hypothetical protein